MSRRNGKIKRAYSQDKLARVCTLPEYEFGRAYDMQTAEVPQPWPHGYYHFRDNGSRVLAVAHLDTVVPGNRRTPRFSNTKNGPLIVSGALDDRLGAYVILHLLPELGVTCDWLLTVGEESGQSTAEFFKPEKDYDWIIEFDRGGTDVVMYQYEDEDGRDAVEASGATMGVGSFSDIAYLEHLGVKAFNWGVGYQGDYHSEKGYAYLNNTFAMVARYLRFHAQNTGTAMPHCNTNYLNGYYDAADYDEDGYDRWGYDRNGLHRDDLSPDWPDCPACQSRRSVNTDTLICVNCLTCLDCNQTEDECQCFNVPDSVALEGRDAWNDGDGIEHAARVFYTEAVS